MTLSEAQQNAAEHGPGAGDWRNEKRKPLVEPIRELAAVCILRYVHFEPSCESALEMSRKHVLLLHPEVSVYREHRDIQSFTRTRERVDLAAFGFTSSRSNIEANLRYHCYGRFDKICPV